MGTSVAVVENSLPVHPACLPDKTLSVPGTINAGTSKVAYNAMFKQFGGTGGLFQDARPGKGKVCSALWPFSQALEAQIEFASAYPSAWNLARVRTGLSAINNYKTGNVSRTGYRSEVHGGTGANTLYDDDSWLAMDLLDAHALTNDIQYLQTAEHIYSFLTTGWDNNHKHPHSGGIVWGLGSLSRTRNAVSTGGVAEVALRLYLLTGRSHYLTEGKSMINWMDRTLLARNGLYYGHIGPRGWINRSQWSYNQGLMIGAKTLLYLATGDRRYLQQAQSLATTAIAAYTPKSRYDFLSQPPLFNAIFFKNLLLLNQVAPNPGYAAAMHTYYQRQERKVNSQTGLIPWHGKVTLETQAATMQIDVYQQLFAQGSNTLNP